MVKLLFVFVVTLILINSSNSQFGGLKDIVTSGINTGKGIGAKIPELFPSPETLFSLSKEAIAGLPFKAVATAINNFCSLALSGDGVKPKISPNITELNFVFFAENENISIPILQSDQLWLHEDFKKNRNVTLLITGWQTDINEQNSAIDLLSEAYRQRGNNNFIALDSARYIDTLYTWSAFNTEELGESVGLALSKLNKIVPVEKMHVIGHSLGAQIAGATGRSFQNKTGKLLPRITGLDPANPCFNEGEQLAGLQRGDADFIDVIHSNSGVLGKRDPLGDVDFYPNGVSALQPGCLSITCSHARAYELYAESVIPGNEKNFPSIRCNSLFTLKTGGCHGDEIFMGYEVLHKVKGNYFFTTKSESPFGKSEVL